MKSSYEWPRKPITWIENRVLYVSIPFTWNLPVVKAKLQQTSFFFERVVVGGPATYLMPDYLSDIEYVKIGHEMPGVLQRINPQATKTTKGCIRNCYFCGVPKFEGTFRELDEWPNLPIVCDNNLLASSKKHFDKAIDRLKIHDHVDFNQGLDIRLLTKYHAGRFAELKKPLIRIALDNMRWQKEWEKAYRILRDAGIPKRSIRSYALIGCDSSPEEAWNRCEWINGHGIKVLPMWFHKLNQLKNNIVTKNQELLGWTDRERKIIMQYYYQRGKHRALILKDYGWRLKNKYVA